MRVRLGRLFVRTEALEQRQEERTAASGEAVAEALAMLKERAALLDRLGGRSSERGRGWLSFSAGVARDDVRRYVRLARGRGAADPVGGFLRRLVALVFRLRVPAGGGRATS